MKRDRTKKYWLTPLMLIPAAASALSPYTADDLTEAQLDSIEKTFSLDEVVVTGTRTPKLLAETPVQTRLITGEEIQKSGATGLQDLLTSVLPGVEFSYAMNQQVNMNLSGFSGQNVLILVDGERLAGETMDNVDFERLAMDNVDHIEIVRGAASSLYGSSATGGVINIITRKQTKKWNANIYGRVADHHEYRFGANVGFKIDKVANTLNITRSGIDTYTVCMDHRDQCDFRRVYGGNTLNVSDRLVWSPRSGLKLTGRAGYYFRERLYNEDTPDRYRDFSGGLHADWDISQADHLELGYSFDQYDKSDFMKAMGLDVRDYSNSQHTVRALFNHTINQTNILTVGGDFRRDYLMTYQFTDNGSRHQYTADIFAQYDWTIDSKWEVLGALRWDYFSDHTTSQITAKASAKYKAPGQPLTIRGGYAGGFRAPTLKEKYMDFDMSGIFDIHGNPNLKAEKSHNFNISAEFTKSHFNYTLGASYNLVSDKISTSAIYYNNIGDPYIEYMNVRSLRVFSVDAAVQARFGNGLTGRVGYNYTHEQTVGGSITQYCPARPHSLNVRLDWSHDFSKTYALNLALTGRVLSAVSYESMIMYEPFDKILIKNPAYTLWKIQATNYLWDGVALTLAIDNIFNYAPKVYYYNSPVTLGTNFIGTLSIDIDKVVDFIRKFKI